LSEPILARLLLAITDMDLTEGLSETRVLAEIEPRLERLPPGHILRASLAWERSHLAQARGDLATAMAAADRAIAIAEASTRRDTQLARNLIRRSEVAFAAGRLDRATADAEAALRLELRGYTAGDFSNLVGLCYLALGRALRQQDRIDPAVASFSSAVEHLRPSVGEQHPATRGATADLAAARVESRRR
jgi:tetratricopeptide (TPR) repeat protein